MNRFEKRKVAIEKAIREEIDAYKGVYRKADDDDRDPTDDERLEIEAHLRGIETLKGEKAEVEANLSTLQHVDDIGRELGPAVGDVRIMSEPQDRMFGDIQRALPLGAKSIGQQFTESKGYQEAIREFKDTGRYSSGFTTGQVALQTKGTLGEAGAGAAVGGGAYVSIPQLVPGAVQQLFQPLTFANLILEGQAQAPTIRYIVEGTATSGATGVAEAGTKPESTLGLTTTDEPIKKIATLLPVSEEMLEDATAIQAYINGRLSLFVQIAEESQLLRGAAGGANVQGILDAGRGLPVYNYAAGTADNKAVALFRAMNSMRGSAFVEPEWVVMHPTDWEVTRLLRDTSGQFYGGGPFLGPYGGDVSQIQPSTQITGSPQDQIWGKPVYVTANIGGPGTALIGTRANAQVWRRGGLSVEATNSHANFFAINLVAIRAEERLGLAVYRPKGYVSCVFGTAAALN
jgi:HK97 family phage major capsid protein